MTAGVELKHRNCSSTGILAQHITYISLLTPFLKLTIIEALSKFTGPHDLNVVSGL